MNKLLVICGPTATGKTSLGIRLAKRFSGEIVSADSRQVYRGMDIGTGKDLPVNAKRKTQDAKLKFKTKNFDVGYYLFDGVPVWMLDVAEPNIKFTVADYYDLAWKVIDDMWGRGKLPVIVGGTGFYIKAVVERIGTMGVEPDWELRERLRYLDIKILGEMLKKLDSKRLEEMNESDRNNSRRLIRAIEIAQGYKVQSTKYKAKNEHFNFDKLIIGLTALYQTLYERIDRRVEERVKMGMEKEIHSLMDKGYNWEDSILGTTIGYREWRDYFEGKASKEEIIQKWKWDEHNYARRQMTWFKKTLRQTRGRWFDITENNWRVKVEKLVKNWYS